jgi:hypothetical protein
VSRGSWRWVRWYATVGAMKDTDPFTSIAAALQSIIEVVQGDEDRMPRSKLEALQRARRYRVELLTWVEAQRSDLR